MRWRYTLFFVFGIGGALLLWFFLRSEPVIKNADQIRSGPILFFGDSLVEGVGATQGQDMPSLLSTALGELVLNYGVAGDTTDTALARVDVALAEQPRLMILLLGGNDFLRKIPREKTMTNLERIITDFQDTGAIVLLLGVRSGIVSGGSDEFYEEIAETTGALYEEDVLEGIFGNASLMSDAIHPNNAGYAKIVERIIPTIKDVLDK